MKNLLAVVAIIAAMVASVSTLAVVQAVTPDYTAPSLQLTNVQKTEPSAGKYNFQWTIHASDAAGVAKVEFSSGGRFYDITPFIGSQTDTTFGYGYSTYFTPGTEPSSITYTFKVTDTSGQQAIVKTKFNL